MNLTANQRLAATLEPLLRTAPAGRAIFVTDGTALTAKAYWSGYGVSKAGIEQLAAAWSIEASVTPLKVSSFDPGPMNTKLRGRAFPGEKPGTQPAPEAAAKRLVALLTG